MKSLRLFTILLIMMLFTTGVVFAVENVTEGGKIVLFRELEVDEDVLVNGEIISIFGKVKIDGMVDGDVISIFGDTEINGTVDGDIVSVLGRIYLSDNATITKDKIQILSGESRDSNGSVRGDEVNIITFEHQLSGLAILLIFIMVSIVVKNIIEFVLSIILLVSMPERMDKIAYATTKRVGRRLGIGLLTVILFYASSVVLGAIVIGVPVIFILVLLKWLLGLGGKTAVKLAIGRKIGKKGNWSQITQLIVGSLIYVLIDITIVGSFILYLGKLVGMGAIVDTKIGTVDQWNMDNNRYSGSSPTYTVVNKEDNREENNSIVEQTPNLQEITENTDDKNC